MEVPVAGVAPAAGLEVVAGADLERLLGGFGEPVDRDDDVLAELAAPTGADRVVDAVAPAPELGDGAGIGRSVDGERAVGEDVDQLLPEGGRLAGRPVRLGDHDEPGPGRRGERPAGAGAGGGGGERPAVEVLERRRLEAAPEDAGHRSAAGLDVGIRGEHRERGLG